MQIIAGFRKTLSCRYADIGFMRHVAPFMCGVSSKDQNLIVLINNTPPLSTSSIIAIGSNFTTLFLVMGASM